ncbi:unnamed protein product [Schistosoma turkestanicum]|nr:unnamed protein product [Schistosoma turkestanicum]
MSMSRSIMKVMSGVVSTTSWTYTSRYSVNELWKSDRLLMVSSYTSRVLIRTTIQIVITLFVVIISSPLIEETMFKEYLIYQLIIAGLFASIGLAIAIVTAVVKKFIDKYAMNFVFVIIYSTCMAIVLGVSNTMLGAITTLGVSIISLVIFISALLIGAAIKTSLVDQSVTILLSVDVVWAVIETVSIVLNSLKIMRAVIGLDIVAEILLFIITIFVSHITVGKLRYILFYPIYALASIFLYSMFCLILYQTILLGSGLFSRDCSWKCTWNCSFNCSWICSWNCSSRLDSLEL